MTFRLRVPRSSHTESDPFGSDRSDSTYADGTFRSGHCKLFSLIMNRLVGDLVSSVDEHLKFSPASKVSKLQSFPQERCLRFLLAYANPHLGTNLP